LLFAYTPAKYRSKESSEHPSVVGAWERREEENSIMSLSGIQRSSGALDLYLVSFIELERLEEDWDGMRCGSVRIAGWKFFPILILISRYRA
jgi:hypothetical protein